MAFRFALYYCITIWTICSNGYFNKPESFCSKKTFFSVFFAAAVISLAIIFTYIFTFQFLGIKGEPLQWPLLVTLLFFGFIAGLIMATINKSIVFKEGLCVAALVSSLPVFCNQYALNLTTYGTSAAYFSAILIISYLLLLLMLTLGGALGYLLFGEGKLKQNWSYETWIGRRFLMTKRRTQAISLITLISVVAVMIGCAGMIVVMSVMNGFSSDLRSKILGSNAHLMVLKYGNDFSEYQKVINKTLKLPGVTGASPFILNEVMVSSENNLSGAIIKGIDIESIAEVSQLPDNIIDGDLSHLKNPALIVNPLLNRNTEDKFNSETDLMERLLTENESEINLVLPGIIIGKEMAKALKIFVGDVVNVVSPIGELGPAGPIPKAKAFKVAGIFYSGMYEYDAKFTYIDLNEAQQFFGMKKSVTGIEYKVKDIDRVQAVAYEIMQVLDNYPYHTKDWMQMNRNLFSALKLEKIAMFIILMALILMASLLILVALIMVVIEKGKEIAILKSMGSSDVSIMKIFVTYGLSIGGLGSGLGLVLGLIICFLIQSFGIGLDPEVYYITRIPIQVDIFELTIVIVGAIIVSFLATIPPALFAAKLKPVEGLRYE
ncbi:MAG: ABC transporter permease [bacterium]|nr:ABC transporter permease [bacterium]